MDGSGQGGTGAGWAGRTPVRLAVGLGDPAREQLFLRALGADDAFVVAARCFSADELLACARSGRVDAVLAGADLHRLSPEGLAALELAGPPLVLLAPSDDPAWSGARCALLAPEAHPDAGRAALLAAARGHPPAGERRRPAPTPAPAPAEGTRPRHVVVAVAGGPGSPGRTTVALGLAAAIGCAQSAVLVDLDMTGPSVAACLDADPTRNLAILAHTEPSGPGEWAHALAQEVQPIGAGSRWGAVLCGLTPKRQLRPVVSAPFVERLVAELRRSYAWVVLDLGADLLGAEATVHRLAVGLADHVLVVASSDLVGLRRGRDALAPLEEQLGVPRGRLALVLNGHDPRHHRGRAEIEWALGRPAAALVPHDHDACQGALALQRPLVLADRGRAARALVDLAERLHGGRLHVPLAPRPIRRWLPRRRGPARTEGDGDDGRALAAG